MKNYFSSLDELINTIPVEKWLILTFPLLLASIALILYLVVKPGFDALKENVQKIKTHKRKVLYLSSAFLLLCILLRSQLMVLKRDMHFADEPFLVFTLGTMWQSNGENIVFDPQRYQNGQNDLACISAIQPKNKDSEHNIIVVLIDGLRSDHLSLYGYQRKTTPFLDSLNTTGRLSFVKNAFSTSNNTIGGIAGLFYSKDWDKFGYNGLNILKFLRKVGYKNYAFLTGFHKEWYGLSALYRNDCDFYYESSMNYNESLRIDDDLKTLEVLKSTPLAKNSFVYLHLLSVHHVGKKYPQFKKFLPDKIGFNVDKKEALVNNYDNGILQADQIIRELFKKLGSDNLLDNATVIITADHGELFGEDGKWSHGGDLHEKLLEIPLIVYDTGKQIVNTQGATIMDIAPTIAERLGYPPPSCWQGISLLRPSSDFNVKVYSNDDNVEYPNGTIEKKGESYFFNIIDQQGRPILSRKKVGSVWQ